MPFYRADSIIFWDLFLPHCNVIPLDAPILKFPRLLFWARLKVIDTELAIIAHNDTNIVSELLVGDQVVSVSIHLIECLNHIYNIDSSCDQRLLYLVTFETAHLRFLWLENGPEWLLTIVVESVLINLVIFSVRFRSLYQSFWDRFLFFSLDLRCSATKAHDYLLLVFIFFKLLF